MAIYCEPNIAIDFRSKTAIWAIGSNYGNEYQTPNQLKNEVNRIPFFSQDYSIPNELAYRSQSKHQQMYKCFENAKPIQKQTALVH